MYEALCFKISYKTLLIKKQSSKIKIISDVKQPNEMKGMLITPEY